MPCSEMANRAVHFIESNGRCRPSSSGDVPLKMLFILFTREERALNPRTALHPGGHLEHILDVT